MRNIALFFLAALMLLATITIMRANDPMLKAQAYAVKQSAITDAKDAEIAREYIRAMNEIRIQDAKDAREFGAWFRGALGWLGLAFLGLALFVAGCVVVAVIGGFVLSVKPRRRARNFTLEIIRPVGRVEQGDWIMPVQKREIINHDRR